MRGPSGSHSLSDVLLEKNFFPYWEMEVQPASLPSYIPIYVGTNLTYLPIYLLTHLSLLSRVTEELIVKILCLLLNGWKFIFFYCKYICGIISCILRWLVLHLHCRIFKEIDTAIFFVYVLMSISHVTLV